MSERTRNVAIGRWRSLLMAVIATIATSTSVRAHHEPRHDGPIVGVQIPAITHGEMLVVANFRVQILDLAEQQPRTDPTLRRLIGFVSLQRFACFWGLIPGSLSDETSPFNECSHAYVAGLRALLAHIVAMPGDQSAAKAVKTRIDAEIASNPAFSAVCSNSRETFDSAVIIGPDWQLLTTHVRTVLIFFGLVTAAVVAFWTAHRRRSA